MVPVFFKFEQSRNAYEGREAQISREKRALIGKRTGSRSNSRHLWHHVEQNKAESEHLDRLFSKVEIYLSLITAKVLKRRAVAAEFEKMKRSL